jgi:cyclic di-GMP phosphodiesterase Gmr
VSDYLPVPTDVAAMLPDPVVVVDPVGTIVWANDAAADLTGLVVAEWIGRSVFDLLHPDDHATTMSAFTTVGGKGLGSLVDVRFRDAAGNWRACETRGRSIPGGAWPGVDEAIVIGVRDVADRHALELGGGDTDRLRAIVHHARAILASLDPHGNIISINSEITRVLGIDSEDIVGGSFGDLLVAEDRQRFCDTLNGMGPLERIGVRASSANGGHVFLEINLTDLRDDGLVRGFTLSATDVTDLKNTQRALRHMADHDALTGLLNRRSLLSELDRLVDGGYEDETVILFCDLDGFKAVNDRIGHAAGDSALVEVARRLERSIRPGDLIGRLGGDEFVVVLPRCSQQEAERISATIRAALIEPIVATNHVIELDVSIGCATSGDSPTAARLLATADDAMYAVKRTRNNTR